jgi:hypothetical protein
MSHSLSFVEKCLPTERAIVRRSLFEGKVIGVVYSPVDRHAPKARTSGSQAAMIDRYSPVASEFVHHLSVFPVAEILINLHADIFTDESY